MREESESGTRKWEEMWFKTTAEDGERGAAVACDGAVSEYSVLFEDYQILWISLSVVKYNKDGWCCSIIDYRIVTVWGSSCAGFLWSINIWLLSCCVVSSQYSTEIDVFIARCVGCGVSVAGWILELNCKVDSSAIHHRYKDKIIQYNTMMVFSAPLYWKQTGRHYNSHRMCMC